MILNENHDLILISNHLIYSDFEFDLKSSEISWFWFQSAFKIKIILWYPTIIKLYGEYRKEVKTDGRSFRKTGATKSQYIWWLSFVSCVFMFFKFSFELFFYHAVFKFSLELLFYHYFQFCCKTFIFISIKQ